MPLTFDDALGVLNAKPPEKRNGPADVVVSTDTRTLRSGDTFLALRGERFDGHQFVNSALQRGAAALIVEEPPHEWPAVPVLIVDDTLKAYMALASAARTKLNATVIAITGSTGKTTTKAFLGQLLRNELGERLTISPANENNEIGVSKLFLNAPSDARTIVVEMGARHYGDIAALVDVARPQIGVLTNVREAHLEIMQTPERLAETKWALFSSGARAVLNARDHVSLQRASTLQSEPRWFGLGPPALPKIHVGERGVFLSRDELRILESDREGSYAVDVRVPGDHNVENLSAAVAAALEAGLDAVKIAPQLSRITLPAGRYETICIPNRPRIIFDAYNASASGTIATLNAFAQEPARRRIAVLGSMAELGAAAVELHRKVGAHAATLGIDYLLVGGENGDDVLRGARDAGFSSDRIITFERNAEAARWIAGHTAADDIVLIKGSRRYKLEEIVEELR